MGIAGMVIGILAIIGMFIAFIPFLGALNWLNIPFAVIGLVLSIIAVAMGSHRGLGIAGIVMCAIAIVFGGIRLILGGGIL